MKKIIKTNHCIYFKIIKKIEKKKCSNKLKKKFQSQFFFDNNLPLTTMRINQNF